MAIILFKNFRLLSLALLFIGVAGLTTLLTIPREEDPTITNRTVVILTPYPGASAERVESLVTEKLEDELRELSEIDTLESNSRNGISVITVSFQETLSDMEGPRSSVRDAVADAVGQFPTGVATPMIDEDRFYAFTLIVALTWDLPTSPNLAILRRHAEELQHRLRNIAGTEYVNLYGAPEEEILIRVDEAQLTSMGLTPEAVARAIGQADAKVAAGRLQGNNNELLLEVRGELDSLERIRQIPVGRSAAGSLLRVGDFATVSRGIQDPPDELALSDNQAAVMVAARMQTQRRVDRWAAAAQQVLTDFEPELSSGVSLNRVFDQSRYTRERLGELIKNLLMGAVLVVLVLFFTLGWRSAVIVTAAIPLTAFIALTILNFSGIPIHQMSVTGLIVALGLLVDSAIVMVDAIQRRLRQGIPVTEAISVSVKRLFTPLLISTLTTALAFLPIALLPGSVGEFVGTIAISVIIALLASFGLAVTLIPALAGRFLAKNQASKENFAKDSIPSTLSDPDKRPNRVVQLFQHSLTWSLNYPKTAIMAAMLLPLLGFFGKTTLTSQFFPEADRNQFYIQLHLPTQTPLAQTYQLARQAHKLILDHEQITSLHWYVGKSAAKFYYNQLMNQDGTANFAEAQVTTTSIATVREMVLKLQTQLDKAFPQAQILVRELKQGPPTNAPVEIRLFGPDIPTLKRLGEAVRLRLSQIPAITHSRASLGGGEPKLWFNANEDEVRLTDLQLVDVAQSLNSQLDGAVNGSLVEANQELPVRIRVADQQRNDLATLASLNVTTPNENNRSAAFPGIPLESLGTLSLQPEADNITRRDGERVNVISAYTKAGMLPATALAQFQSLWKEQPLPLGYRMEFGGDSEARADALTDLVRSVPLIITLSLGLLVVTFNSFRLAGVIVLVAAQAFGLGLLALTIFQYPFGFQPIIGLIGLTGVAINAAIIILSALRLEPQAVAGDIDTIRATVMASSRHIISTTITTFGGFLPLMLAEGGFWPPFAAAIAGGVLLSTVVSFYFVPPCFLLLTRRRAISASHSGNYHAPITA